MRLALVLTLVTGWVAWGCTEAPVEHEPPTTVKSTDAGQPEYTYPGCANEDGPGCPRSATAHCAVGLAAQGRMICTEDYDCELVWLTPRCLDVCEPMAVGFEELVEARASMQYEIDRYCRMGPCTEQPCADAGSSWVAACSMGFCAAVRPDAGVELDAGIPDA